MWPRKYIIGHNESTECPWCAMPLGNNEEAVELITEEETLQEGFCSVHCVNLWVDKITNDSVNKALLLLSIPQGHA
jgi:hypothetical protein|tara:strand:- start:209 stop:436 length:228 start_codon:yes stop_codon:yes gene_type:complete